MKQNYLGLNASSLPLSIYLCFLIFLTGCGSCNPPIPPNPPVISDLTPGPISNRLVARIYFDASVSMQGFVVPNSTQYKNILRPLESVITSGWKSGKTEFFSFGENVQKINRDKYLSVSSEDFYVEWRTYIQKIFEYEQQLVRDRIGISNTSQDSLDVDTPSNDTNDSTEENHMVVIVTDLFQDRRDVNLLVSQLKEKYIKNGLEVGLLGLRSEFDGKVYNLGTAPILYRSTPGNPETFRPFYLLVIGKHADIAHYFDRLMANGFSDANTVIFSRYLVSPLVSFADVEDSNIDPDNLNIKIINSDYSQDTRLKQYEIVRSSDPAKISAKLKYVPLPHVMFFDADPFEVSIIAKCSDENETKIRKAQECMEVTSKLKKNDNGNDELNVNFSLDSQSLSDNTVYLYEVALLPGIDSYRTPDWCSGWDMGTARDGSRTLNLVNFVSGLTETTAREHNTEIAQFYFYIKKR